MFCPTCGSEERQLIQYCRACGTDLRVIRIGLEQPDAITASALTARDHIGRAIADKIRETQSTKDLKKVAEEVLPEIEKFLETPDEKRLRRIRAGVVFASIGLGATLIFSMLSAAENDFFPLIGFGAVFFFLGIGIIINGLVFTKPRRQIPDEAQEALAQKHLDAQFQNVLNPSPSAQPPTNELNGREAVAVRPSVTEHTTHQLRSNKS
jgi:hypothetical protein